MPSFSFLNITNGSSILVMTLSVMFGGFPEIKDVFFIYNVKIEITNLDYFTFQLRLVIVDSTCVVKSQ